MEIGVIKTKTSNIWKDEDNIVHHQFLPDSQETLETAKDNISKINELMGYEKYVLLSDASDIKSITRDARMYYSSSDDVKKCCMAVACISKTKTGRIIGNFLTSFNKTKFPFKIFNSEEEAILWLKSFKT